MLLKLTNKCYECCSHCMECSGPDGEHMSLETFKDAVEFFRHTKVRAIAISGGEFTLVPDFYDKIEFLVKRVGGSTIISLQSNGSFIEDDEKVRQIKKLLRMKCVVGLQISTNKKFYPNYEWTMSHKADFEAISSKVSFYPDWQLLHRLGRAQNLIDEKFDRNPSCSPIVSRANQINKLGNVKDLTGLLQMLELSGYICKPMISETGSVHIGECQFCTKLGDINGYSTMPFTAKEVINNQIYHNMINSVMCDKCGEVKNMKGKVPEKVITTRSFKSV